MASAYLLAEFVRSQNATVDLRGLRAVSDFDNEFQLADITALWRRNWRACLTQPIIVLYILYPDP